MVTEGANTKAQVLEPCIHVQCRVIPIHTQPSVYKLITEAHICQFMQGHWISNYFGVRNTLNSYLKKEIKNILVLFVINFLAFKLIKITLWKYWCFNPWSLPKWPEISLYMIAYLSRYFMKKGLYYYVERCKIFEGKIFSLLEIQ